MSRWRVVVLIAGAVLVAGTDPASAAITTNTFDAVGRVGPGGRTAHVTVELGCEPDGAFSVEVTVAQGDTIAIGRRHGRCTGATERYAVTVAARNGGRLTAGHAEICGEASTRQTGVIDDTRRWCRTDGVDLQER